MIYDSKPDTFNPRFCVSGCFLKIKEDGQDKFLMFLRQDHKPQGNTWSVPAGKIEENEDASQAMLRELEEETGLKFSLDDLNFHKRFFILYNFEEPAFDFEYNIYSIDLSDKPEIKIDLNDHKEFKWVTPEEALQLNLIPDEEPCIRLVYGI